VFLITLLTSALPMLGKSMKKWIWFLVKAGVSFLLLSVLLTRVQTDQLLDAFRRMDLRYLFVALGVNLILQILCAYRWRLFAQPLGFHESFMRFAYYYYAGTFFNLFLPTSIGGDVSRCYYLVRERPDWQKAVITVLADRGMGFVAMVFILTVALFQPNGRLFSPQMHLGMTILAFLLIAGMIVPFFLKGALARLDKPFSFPLVYWTEPTLLLKTLLLSILFQTTVIGAHILVGLSLGLEIPGDFYFIFPTLAAVAGMLPISLSGLGVREGAYVLLLSKVGISWENGLAFGLGWLLVLLLSSLIGGIIWITNPLSWAEGRKVNKQA
jgi:uncharacterized membrane protein YbhN (UPF0104 family)